MQAPEIEAPEVGADADDDGDDEVRVCELWQLHGEFPSHRTEYCAQVKGVVMLR